MVPILRSWVYAGIFLIINISTQDRYANFKERRNCVLGIFF